MNAKKIGNPYFLKAPRGVKNRKIKITMCKREIYEKQEEKSKKIEKKVVKLEIEIEKIKKYKIGQEKKTFYRS